MLVETRNSGGTSTTPLETKYFGQRDLFIRGEITEKSTDDFCEEFVYLVRQSKEPIRIWISSPGGSLPAGLRIVDLIQSAKDSNISIITLAYGPVYSMAAIVFSSGTQRLMLPHCKLMLHPAAYSDGYGGSLKDMTAKAEMLKEYEDTSNRILSQNTGKTVEEIVENNGYDHFYSAEEAIIYGLCDRIANISDFVKQGEQYE